MQLSLHIFTTLNKQEQRHVLQSHVHRNILEPSDQVLPAAVVKIHAENRQVSSVQRAVALMAVNMCWFLGGK